MSELSTCGAIEGLLAQFATGDASAKDALVRRAHDALIVVTRKQLRQFPGVHREEETVAIFNDSFERIGKALDAVRPTTARAFFGLAAVQIRRVLLDLVRKGKRGSEPPPKVTRLDGPAEGGAAVNDPGKSDTGYARKERQEDVITALDRLSVEEREVVELLFFYDLTQAEAAEVLGVHKDTVKYRWTKARVKLADILSDYGASG